MVIKSITGSHKVIDILNRLGHSMSYTTVEELQTELTFGESNREQITHTGMNLKPSLTTGVAFDNFHRFVETLSGKGTPHGSVEKGYQLPREEIVNSDKSMAFPEKISQEEIPDVDLEVTHVNESQNLTHQNHLGRSISKNSKSRKDIGKIPRRAYEAKGTDIEP